MTREVDERVQERHSKVVQGFLWALLAVVVAVSLLNVLLLGEASLPGLAPNLLFAALIGSSLFLNRRGRFRLAVGLLTAIITLIASLAPLATGLTGSGVSLYIFFVPLGLAGFLLDRKALYLTAGWSVLVALAAPLLHGVPLFTDEGFSPAWQAALQFGAVFVVMTLFLDRFSVAFRSTLGHAIQHEMALKEEAQERLRTYEQLLEERRVNETIMEHLPGIFFVLDATGRYLRWNRNFSEWLGYGEREIKSMTPQAFFDARDHARPESAIAQVFEEGATTLEAEVVARDGTRHPYFLTGARVSMGGEKLLAGIGIDRTDIDRARSHIDRLDRDLRERLERITALHEIDKAITGSYDLERTLDVVLEQVTSRLQVDAAAILLERSAPGSCASAPRAASRTRWRSRACSYAWARGSPAGSRWSGSGCSSTTRPRWSARSPEPTGSAARASAATWPCRSCRKASSKACSRSSTTSRWTWTTTGSTSSPPCRCRPPWRSTTRGCSRTCSARTPSCAWRTTPPSKAGRAPWTSGTRRPRGTAAA